MPESYTEEKIKKAFVLWVSRQRADPSSFRSQADEDALSVESLAGSQSAYLVKVMNEEA